MIPKPKTVDSETKTHDSETKNGSETKKMIPKPRTTGKQGSFKNVICKNVIVPPPHPTAPFGDDAIAQILVAK